REQVEGLEEPLVGVEDVLRVVLREGPRHELLDALAVEDLRVDGGLLVEPAQGDDLVLDRRVDGRRVDGGGGRRAGTRGRIRGRSRSGAARGRRRAGRAAAGE